MTKGIKQEGISKEMVSEAVREYCTTKNFSQNDLAVKSGISGATINKVLTGKWKDISEVMWKKLWNVVSNTNTVTPLTTNDFRAIKKGCDLARKEKFMIGITGDTGIGKTTALRTLSLRRNTFYVTYDITQKSRQFFGAILKEMGIAFEGSIHDMVNKIADELNVLNEPLLIIDEAGKLTHNVMLYMHVLRDKTAFNCGVVLAGMPYFKTNLKKNSNKQKIGYAEFLRRVNIWHELNGLTRSEIESICIANGIKTSEEIKNFYQYKRFGDLMNEINLYQIDIILSTLNE